MKTGTIVFITSVPPFSRYHGNIKRINDLILDMAGMGHQVHVCYHRDGAYLLAENFPPGVTWDVYVPRVSWRIAKRLRDRGIYWANRLLNRFGWFVNHPLDGWMDPAYVGYLRRTLAGRAPPAAVIAEYVWMTGAFAAFPEQTPKIVDTIDVFTERKKLCHSRGVPYHEFSLSARAEIKGLNRSDAVLAIAREELAFFQSRLKAVCSLYEPAFPPRARKAREGSPRNILFVASNNTANVKAGAALLAAWAQLPPSGFELHIVGLVCAEIQPLCTSDRVVFHGPVRDLDPHYEAACLSVVPLDVGTGMSIKTIEALSHGVPVLSTRTGARGLERFLGRGIVTYERPEALGPALQALLSDPGALPAAGEHLDGELTRYRADTDAQRAELAAWIQGRTTPPTPTNPTSGRS